MGSSRISDPGPAPAARPEVPSARARSGQRVGLACFDLDHTLIGGDSDSLWVEFLVARKCLSGRFLERNRRYYRDYQQGTLDMAAFLEFQLAYFSRFPLERLLDLRREFVQESIRPLVLPRAEALIRSHEEQQNETLIITATNRFVTEPIAALLGVPHLIAVDLEVVGGRFTGRPAGIPSFQEGKVERLREWQRERDAEYQPVWFYSDSHNDLPLLRRVDHPVAVDPDDRLRIEAARRDWPIISLR